MDFHKVLFLCVFLFMTKYVKSEALGGPADLNIKSIEFCPNPDDYKYSVNVTRHKLNRTHEAFDGYGELGVPMDENMGIYIDVAKKTKNGSYKPNAFEFRDNYACLFLMKWVGKSFIELLTQIGEPQICPVKAGSYSVKNFIIDYRQMPLSLPYGDFRADTYLLKDGEKISCMRVFLMTKPKSLLEQ